MVTYSLHFHSTSNDTFRLFHWPEEPERSCYILYFCSGSFSCNHILTILGRNRFLHQSWDPQCLFCPILRTFCLFYQVKHFAFDNSLNVGIQFEINDHDFLPPWSLRVYLIFCFISCCCIWVCVCFCIQKQDVFVRNLNRVDLPNFQTLPETTVVKKGTANGESGTTSFKNVECRWRRNTDVLVRVCRVCLFHFYSGQCCILSSFFRSDIETCPERWCQPSVYVGVWEEMPDCRTETWNILASTICFKMNHWQICWITMGKKRTCLSIVKRHQYVTRDQNDNLRSIIPHRQSLWFCRYHWGLNSTNHQRALGQETPPTTGLMSGGDHFL